MQLKSLAIAAAAILAIAGAAEARDRIRIVGSSTVFPFAAKVVEQFGRVTRFKTPVLESTGSGGGLKLFCAGIGVRYPDIANASRRIKKSEIERCAGNGVTEIVEVMIGYDGIVIASSKTGPEMKLSKRQIYLALAKTVPADETGEKLIDNPYAKWSDIDKSLPDTRILVLGPPPTSGTRDAFVEIAMEGGCRTFPAIAAMRKTDRNNYKAICHGIREDGAFVQAGENDNLIVQKLVANPDAFGVFGFAFLDQNADRIRGAVIGGVEPSFENIADGSYGVSRSLYFYVKKAHVGVIPGIREYIRAFTSDKASGPEGYLADTGLIPMPDAERRKNRAAAMRLTPLAM